MGGERQTREAEVQVPHLDRPGMGPLRERERARTAPLLGLFSGPKASWGTVLRGGQLQVMDPSRLTEQTTGRGSLLSLPFPVDLAASTNSPWLP